MVLGAPWVPLGAGCICWVLMEQGRESAGLGGTRLQALCRGFL